MDPRQSCLSLASRQLTGEMNVLLIEPVVKSYHQCPFTVRTGESFVLENKSAPEERHSELWTRRATGTYSKRACDNSMAAIKRALATYHGFQLIRLSKTVFNTLSIKFFVFSPHLKERQQLNNKSLLRKRENYNVRNSFTNKYLKRIWNHY